MERNYFAILGVTSRASPGEIRAAYRRLAKRFHPDHYAGGSEPFLEIQEAYSVLADPHKRKKYEKSLVLSSEERPVARGRPGSRKYYSGPEPLIPEPRTVEIRDVSPLRSARTIAQSLDEMFSRAWGNLSIFDWPGSGRQRNMTVEVPLTMTQAMRGGRVRVMVPAPIVCPVCNGYGGVGLYECSRCGGEGAITREVPFSVSFPAGLRGDHAVAIPLSGFGAGNIRLIVLFRLKDNSLY